VEKEGTGAQWGNLNAEFGINQDRTKNLLFLSMPLFEAKYSLSDFKEIHEHCRMHDHVVL
jgi:hypothetical protein